MILPFHGDRSFCPPIGSVGPEPEFTGASERQCMKAS
jgi:hypothetical protein